jgi:hypothetical protein
MGYLKKFKGNGKRAIPSSVHPFGSGITEGITLKEKGGGEGMKRNFLWGLGIFPYESSRGDGHFLGAGQKGGIYV